MSCHHGWRDIEIAVVHKPGGWGDELAYERGALVSHRVLSSSNLSIVEANLEIIGAPCQELKLNLPLREATRARHQLYSLYLLQSQLVFIIPRKTPRMLSISGRWSTVWLYRELSKLRHWQRRKVHFRNFFKWTRYWLPGKINCLLKDPQNRKSNEEVLQILIQVDL